MSKQQPQTPAETQKYRVLFTSDLTIQALRDLLDAHLKLAGLDAVDVVHLIKQNLILIHEIEAANDDVPTLLQRLRDAVGPQDKQAGNDEDKPEE